MKTASPNLSYSQLSELASIVRMLQDAEQLLVDFSEEHGIEEAFLISGNISETINQIDAL